MAKANKIAARDMAAIEGRASQMTSRLSASFSGIGGNALTFFKGLGAGALAAMGPIALFQKTLEAIDNASHLVDTADRVGLSTKALQELTFGFSQASVEASEFESAMDKFSKNIGEAAVSGNYLGKILKANGIAIRDQNGHIKTSEQLLADYADLVKNASSEQEKMLLVTTAFGRGGAAMLVGLNDGAQGILNMKKAAADAGGVIDEQLLRRAEEMGDRWDAAWHRFAVSSQSAILTALEGMDDLSSRMNKFLVQRQAAELGDVAGSLVGKPGDVLTGPGKGNRTVDPIESRIAGAFGGEITKADDALVAQLKAHYGDAAHKSTVVPPSGNAPKASGPKFAPKTADDRFAEDIKAIEDRTAALNEEMFSLGLSFEAQQKRKVALDLEQEALKQVREEARKKGEADWQNAQLSPAQTKAIDDVSNAYAKQAEELRKAQEAQDLQRDVLKGALGDLRSALDDGKITWRDLGDVALSALDKIIDKIENDLIDAIDEANSAGGRGGGGVLGSLLSLLGFGGGSSQPAIVGGDPWAGMRFDTGGFTGPGGKNQPAGIVHKGEYVFDQDAVKRIGVGNLAMLQRGYANGGLVGAPSLPRIQAPANQNGAPSITFAPTINMPNAQRGAGEEVAQVLKKFEREFTPRVLKSLRDARTTGMV
ncbi:hypothetical protein LB521_04445 [Mesorhizobium sp. BR-1-1-8]|uniref:hypothetical protein n=1 Tax=Mesorhizobium sp. BR-1-1-8 TaxID=2876659 RepID=UPI001CCFB490|nr:hypothetical protein [Mesorhizobium sp. BR-1-1-8]MBZ9980396.1 hypothetical protein [Mesorhizobium sp. BR-1-1-8]